MGKVRVTLALAAAAALSASSHAAVLTGGKMSDMAAAEASSPGVPSRLHPYVHLSPNYDVNEIPIEPGQPFRDGSPRPLLVNFSINLANILAIDEPNQVSQSDGRNHTEKSFLLPPPSFPFNLNKSRACFTINFRRECPLFAKRVGPFAERAIVKGKLSIYAHSA